MGRNGMIGMVKTSLAMLWSLLRRTRRKTQVLLLKPRTRSVASLERPVPISFVKLVGAVEDFETLHTSRMHAMILCWKIVSSDEVCIHKHPQLATSASLPYNIDSE